VSGAGRARAAPALVLRLDGYAALGLLSVLDRGVELPHLARVTTVAGGTAIPSSRVRSIVRAAGGKGPRPRHLFGFIVNRRLNGNT